MILKRNKDKETTDRTVESTAVKKISRREITSVITTSVITYLVKKRQAVFKELGLKTWGARRADVIGLTMKTRQITMVEVKSCHSDYKSDQKFLEYLPFCNVFYIAVPHESKWIDQYRSILKEHGIGIMELNKYGTIRIIQNPKKRTMKKRIKLDLLVRIAWRCGSYSLRTHYRPRCKISESGIRYTELSNRTIKNL